MNITTFLNNRGFQSFEGYSQQVPEQVKDLVNLTRKPYINVMEIGFNAGHSSEIFLQNNKNLHVTSFDLGGHAYIPSAKEYIDATYPNRHTLILGNSTVSVPEYIQKNPETKFDFIFIDGGHDYETAKADLQNCFHLSHQNTIVALDDTMFHKGWEQPYTIGPTKAWTEHLNEKKIVEIARKDYCIGRGISWGKYIHKNV